MSEGSRTVLIVAIIAVVLSFFSALVVFVNFGQFSQTGYVSQGDTNLTITASATINFTTASIDWGEGQIDFGQTFAILSSRGWIENGNWTNVTEGFVIENIGNTNVSLNVSVGKTAAQFIGGTNPGYGWYFDNSTEGQSCYNSSGTGSVGLTLESWFDASTTTTEVCSIFRYESANDEVEIDINVTIPENAPTGAKGDILTATVVAL